MRLVGDEGVFYGVTIGKIGMDVGIAGLVGETGQPGFLQFDVVVVGKTVEADHLVATLKQAHGHMGADEAGRAGHEHFHAGCSVIKGVRPRHRAAGRI